MANLGGSKPKEPVFDVDFQWGKMQQQDIPGQFTRSMMEMRKPKAYELSDAPPLPKQPKRGESTRKEIEISTCSITSHSILLLNYIKQAEELISRLERSYGSTYAYTNQMTELSTPPPFIPEHSKPAAASSRSRSSSSGKSSEETEEKLLFARLDPRSNFRAGTKICNFPQMDDATTSRILKKSVATVAAHTGYVESTMSSLNVLTGVAESFMISFSKSLRNAADMEAQTGSTAFFDCLDQALHENGSSFKEIQDFWQTRIVKRHKSLQKQAENISKTIQTMKNPNSGAPKRSVKPEKNQQQSFPSSSYGKWTPVAGMSSSPFQPARTGWTGQDGTYGVKSEPRDSSTMSSYAFRSTPQTSNIKSEQHGGFDL